MVIAAQAVHLPGWAWLLTGLLLGGPLNRLRRWWLERRRNSAKAAVLRALKAFGPASSYPLGESTGLRPHRLYPALDWLERTECIAAEWSGTAEGPSRRFYRITQKGENVRSRLEAVRR